MPAVLRPAFAFVCCLLSTLAQTAEDPEARAWLERMSQALSARSYEGRFVHFNDARTETMRIIHRGAGGVVTERLVALDGSGREIIRTDAEVTCYLPDKRTVLVTKRGGGSTLVATVPAYSSEMQLLYDIRLGAASKLLGRATQLIVVQPRDEFRYGYKLWLDSETAMPLKSQLSSRDGRVVEQMAFAELDMRDDISADALKPGVNTEGFRWLRQETPDVAAVAVTGWSVVKLPPGFKLTITRVQAMAGSSAPVRHLVYSDGLASVSVFIEPTRQQASMHGLTRVGSAFAFSVDVKGHQITAVGEVPPVTVQSIATAVTPAAEK